MGHYDDQYEETARQYRAITAKSAQTMSTAHGVKVLSPTTFKVIGVCEECAGLVRSLPNWGCTRQTCPHKP